MRKYLLLLISALTAAGSASAHIDVVYPKECSYKTSAASVFFIGNTTEGAQFSINSKSVKLWNDNFFVHVVPLKYGNNAVKMISVKDGLSEELICTVQRTSAAAEKKAAETYQPKKAGFALYAETIKNYAPVRLAPSNSAERLIDLPKGAGMYLAGRQGNFYKIDEKDETGGSREFWIHKSNISAPAKRSERGSSIVKHINRHHDKHYTYIDFQLSSPALFSIEQKENGLELIIYGARNKNAAADKNAERNYKYQYKQLMPLLGCEAYYSGNTLILKIAKTPAVKNLKKPLKGVPIYIDPGHGGEEKGAIGATRVCEKDINLAISLYLAEYLKHEGADVKISRTGDEKKGLYDRVDEAKKHNALISLSIHANALADGRNPYEQHGTEVHYYNKNAEFLAQTIQKDLAESLNFKDNGIHKSSFALTRSSNPVSVLVECAYMIHPEEYIRLINPEIQKKAARSIAESLKKYIISVQPQQNKTGS